MSYSITYIYNINFLASPSSLHLTSGLADPPSNILSLSHLQPFFVPCIRLHPTHLLLAEIQGDPMIQGQNVSCIENNDSNVQSIVQKTIETTVLGHWEHFWKAFGFIFQSESSRATYFCPSFTTNWTHTNVHHPVPIPFRFFFRILSPGYCCLQFFKWFQWTPEQYMSELGVSREGPRPRRDLDLNPNRQIGKRFPLTMKSL